MKKGRSAAYLRALRKKHGLGEFRRGRAKSVIRIRRGKKLGASKIRYKNPRVLGNIEDAKMKFFNDYGIPALPGGSLPPPPKVPVDPNALL